MLDTVGTKHFYQSLIRDDFLRRWRYLSNKRNQIWTLNAKGSKTLPNLTMIQTPNGIWHLSSMVSLPKMLFGHNAHLPNQAEVFEGLQMISEYVEANSGLSFDVSTATVSLIHFAEDVCLPQAEILRLIRRLAEKTLPPMLKDFCEDSTLYFTTKAKTKQVRIYSKLKEVLDKKRATVEAIENARGKLRFESCFLKKYAIDSLVKRLDLPDRTTRSLLTEDVSNLVLSELLERLNFYELLSDDKSNLEILLERFPTRKAMNLDGFLNMVNLHGENFYKDKNHRFSKDSYYQSARECRKAKVWARA
jgi:hypothetical protein